MLRFVHFVASQQGSLLGRSARFVPDETRVSNTLKHLSTLTLLISRERFIAFSRRPSYKSSGGRTPTASIHETKDVVLLHSWFRLESAHRSSTCLRLITSSVVDDMTSSSEEGILMYCTEYWCLSPDAQKWNMPSLAARVCSMKLTSASWLRSLCGGSHNLIHFNCAPFFASCRRYRVLTVTCLDCYMSWRMPVCGLPYIVPPRYLLFTLTTHEFSGSKRVDRNACLYLISDYSCCIVCT
jgi:hypothetical protein